MKYFQPELLAQCRSQDDDTAEVAAKSWEEAIGAYLTHYKSIEPQLPSEVIRLASRFSLHDAKLLGVAFGARDEALFGILLRLESDASGQMGKVLQLHYQPEAGPNGGVVIKPAGADEQNVPKDVWVLYDELDFNEEHTFFTHNLLLSDGREIEVRFKALDVHILDEVLTPTLLPAGERTWEPITPVS